MSSRTDLPSVRRALWRAVVLAYRAEPRLLVVSFALVTASWLPDALTALWLKYLAAGVLEGRSAQVGWASAGLAASGAGAWLLRIVGDRIHFLFRERATIAIEAHVAHLQGSVVSIEHHERPEYLDRLQILKDQAFLLNHLYHSAMSTLGSGARLGIAVVLLMTVHPALAVLVLFAAPTVLVSSWRAGVERATEESAAPHRRLAKHLFDVATTAGPAKEVRVTRTGPRIVQRRRAAWEAWFDAVSATRWRSAMWHAGAWLVFGCAYVGAIVFVASGLGAGAADVLLVLAAGANLSRYLSTTAGQADFLRWCIDAARRLVWLEDYAASRTEGADLPAPDRLSSGIRLESVSFTYPGTERLVLEDVNLDLPAGTVVAVVGENGAGKSTLVKLLCRFYEPTSGRITVDGVPLSRIRAESWRARLAGTFQDFFRFEFFARRTVGLGDLDRGEQEPVLHGAVARAGATDVVDRLPRGLDTQLGPTWDDGVELSFGQWQKLAVARGFMREGRDGPPLLLVLDEPTAALDAETEHALFERYAGASRAGAHEGRITVLVSHRFSTVRMADLIVVLDGARVAEFGTHEELMARGGTYAELYGIQARGYR